jgi:hypothetical protein
MTAVEQILYAANRRHFHDINLAAHKPAAKRLGWADCRHCGATLTMAEIAENHCSACGKDGVVRHG